MSCINEKLMKIVSDKVNVQEMDRIDDPKDKLISKIYMKKVDSLLRDSENKYMLQLCQYCKRLYSLDA